MVFNLEPVRAGPKKIQILSSQNSILANITCKIRFIPLKCALILRNVIHIDGHDDLRQIWRNLAINTDLPNLLKGEIIDNLLVF